MPDVADRPCPECAAGKCGNCTGTAWDDTRDQAGVCPCWLAHRRSA